MVTPLQKCTESMPIICINMYIDYFKIHMCGQFLWYLYTDTYCIFERKLNKYTCTHYVYTSKKCHIFIRYIQICDQAIVRSIFKKI